MNENLGDFPSLVNLSQEIFDGQAEKTILS